MTKRKPKPMAPPLADLVEPLRGRVRSPVGIVLGSPKEAADLVAATGLDEVLCYQMDLYQAARLHEELATRGLRADVETRPDLWDLSRPLQTLLYPAPQKGERILKIDMIEQAFHVLTPQGTLIALAPYDGDTILQPTLRKVFGSVHVPAETGSAAVWCQRQGDRPRRRHEMTFHVRVDETTSLEFLSRPGVFSYGRLDDGARTLTEAMTIEPGDRVVDLGCGTGAVGIIAARRSGPEGFTVFVDSNVRAIALAEQNARALGVERFTTIATPALEGLDPGSFDVVLANPPYYAQLSIAERFLDCGYAALKRRGRFYLVTRLVDPLYPLVEDRFGEPEIFERRGYFVFAATK